MNIIEKLGITKSKIEYGDIVDHDGVKIFEECIYGNEDTQNANLKCYSAAPEMLEALLAIECNETLSMDAQLEIQTVCEKATGKTWAEIKELL